MGEILQILILVRVRTSKQICAPKFMTHSFRESEGPAGGRLKACMLWSLTNMLCWGRPCRVHWPRAQPIRSTAHTALPRTYKGRSTPPPAGAADLRDAKDAEK